MSVYIITTEASETNALTEEEDKKSSAGSGGGSAGGLETKTLIWRITTRKFDSIKPEWIYAQVAIGVDTSYRVQFEGEASDGGFALDDITYYEGTCQSKSNRHSKDERSTNHFKPSSTIAGCCGPTARKQ